MSQLLSEVEPQAHNAQNLSEGPVTQAQDAGSPPERPLPPIPSEKAVPSENIAWHESQVQNSRYFQRFYHDPAKYAARNLLTPSDIATAAHIAPFYSDLKENELPWPKAWEMDAAPLKRKLVHHSWKEALKRNGIDPLPARDGPVDNGPVDNGPVDNGPVDNGPVDNGSSNSGGVSEEDLSNSDADQAHVVSSNNGRSSVKEGPAVSYPDLAHVVNSDNAQNQDLAGFHLENNASNNGSAFGKGGGAASAADQNRVVNSIDTQNQARPDFSLRPRRLQNGVSLNRSQQHVGSSKPVPHTSAPTLGPKAEDAVGGYGSISPTILAVSDQVLLEPRPMRVDREPAVLGLSKLYEEGDLDAQIRRFNRWWKQLAPERQVAILEESKQARMDGDGGGEGE